LKVNYAAEGMEHTKSAALLDPYSDHRPCRFRGGPDRRYHAALVLRRLNYRLSITAPPPNQKRLPVLSLQGVEGGHH
jgi:hypothetical protein